jgi:signal peptidase II
MGRFLFFFVAVLTFLADRLTKAWAVKALSHKSVVLIPKFLQLRLAENAGAAFSLFSSTGGPLRLLLLVVLPLLVVLGVVYYALKESRSRLTYLALGLICGGALGNLYDRLLSGKVVDFVDFHYGPYHYPTFNLADVAVVLGLLLLLWRRG